MVFHKQAISNGVKHSLFRATSPLRISNANRIEVADITFRRASPNGDLSILDRFQIEFEPGRVYSIMGPNGCGKSTFLKIMAGVYQPDEGDIRIPQPDNAVVCYLPQDYRSILFGWKTVRKNVAPWWNKSVDAAVVLALLNDMGIADQADKYPAQLSGGQQQCVLLARMLADRPDFAFFDEPFSALDSNKKVLVSNAIESRRKADSTFVCAVHDPADAVRISDFVIVCSGPPLQIRDRIACKSLNKPELLLRIHRALEPDNGTVGPTLANETGG